MTGDSIVGTSLNDQKDTCIHWPAMLWTVEAIGYKLVFTDISVWLYNFLHIPQLLAMSLFYYKDFRLQNCIAPKHQTQYPSSSQMTLFEKHWWRIVDDVTRQPPVHWLSIGNLSQLNHRWKHNWVNKIELSNISCITSVFSSHYLGKTMKDSAWWRKALPSANSSTYRNFDSLNPQGYCITVSDGHFQTAAKDGHCGCPNSSLKTLKATRFSKSHWQWTPLELGVE
jgi:hypothetical protein